MKRTIVVVDDHPLMRRALIALIEGEPDLAVSAEAGDGKAALLALARRPPNLAIVDLMLKGGADGLDFVKAMKINHPGIPTLVLSMHEEALYAERALRAGAHGYVNKQQLCDDVLKAIRRVLDGQIYVSEAFGTTLAARFVGDACPAANSFAALSDRELQVFRLIGVGSRTREIATTLHLSPKTIETYREHIKQKLGLENASELLRHAIRFVESGE
ncbi:response regulator transcription factor [Bradyrhizobium sp. SRS-191]|uniref:response regulator transcription factor n=1 Tax=Bradyrhizobium sp. SRS-191 TaxID=2962606 RepID=UPI00211DF0C9|nr:response regulator transcription factor [Bradyrhizobium sp. SRS-191]